MDNLDARSVFFVRDAERSLRSLGFALGIKTTVLDWGNPTLAIQDVDENELLIWLPEGEIASFAASSQASAEA